VNERAFADKRQADWERLEQLVAALEARKLSGRDQVRDVLRLYRRAAADLAEAQTQLPRSATVERLQLLVGRAYGAIYRNPEDRVGLTQFVIEKLPRTFRDNVGYFLAALLTFGAGLLLGIIMVSIDESWAQVALPEQAITQVENGQLWTDIFTLVPPSLTSALVFYNNTAVCFTAFALGLTLGVGTLYVLFVNGLVLGSAMSLCWRYDLLDQLAAFVVGHGVLELSAIMMAGAAGLMLGDALARPGPYRRLDALRMRARDAAVLAVGAIPFLAEAGFIEGFISPGNLMAPVKYLLGIATGLLMYSYLLTAGKRTDAAYSKPLDFASR